MPVKFYDPGGQIAAAARAQAMLGPRTAKKPAKPEPTQHGDAYEYGLRLAAKAPVRAAPPPKQEQPSGPGGILGRGLGMLINNPIARTVLRPLDVLDVPRRAVWSTINEAADLFNGGDASLQDWYDQTNPFHAITQKGDTSFGAGTVLPDINTPLSEGFDKWINRGIGLAGDIAGDPLTYLDGIGFVADIAKVSRELEKLNEAQKAIKPLVALEEKAARFGLTPDVMPAGVAGAAERAAALGGTAELERLGRRSLTGTNPVQRSVMDIPEPGLGFKVPFTRMQPKIIPGTAPIATAGAGLKASIKEAGRGLPGMARVREMRAPLGVLGNELFPAQERILTGRGTGTIQGAIDTIGTDNQARLAAGKFSRVAADELNRAAEEVKHLTPEQRAEMIRLAEEDPNVTNVWTDYQQKVIDIGKWAGVDIPEIQGGRYVMPHVLDRGFRNHLMNLSKANDPRAAAFMDEAGLTVDDLLEEGGFMQRRQWRPNEDGTPFKAKIGDKEFDIEIGSVDELNTKLAQAFPDYQGKIYETDPVLAWRGYIQGTKKDVAKRFAYEDAARRAREGVERRAPQPQQFDPYGGRIDLPPRKGPNGEDIPVQQVVKQEFEMTPEQARYYRPDTHTPSAVAATKKRNKEILKTQPKLLEEYRTASHARRIEIAEELETVTDDLLGPISAERSRMLSYRITAANTRDEMAGKIEELQKIELPAIQAEIDTIDDELKRISSARSGVSRTAQNRTRRRQDQLLDRLDEQRRALIQQRDDMAEVYRQRSTGIPDEAQKKLDDIQGLAPDRRRAVIRDHDKEMNKRVRRAHEKYVNKRYELIRKWQARGEFGKGRTGALRRNRFGLANGIDPGGFASANRYLQEHGDDLARFNQYEDEVMRLRREVHGKYARDIDELTDNIAEETKELNRHKNLDPMARQQRQDYITEMVNRRAALQKQQNKLMPQLNAAEKQLNSKEMKVIAEALEYRTNHKRWLEYHEVNSGQERSALVEAQREMDAWEKALGEEAAWTGPIPERPPASTAPVASPEVEKAQKYLETNAAFNYVRDRNRLANLKAQTPDGERFLGVKDPKIQAALRAEKDALEKSLAKRAATGRKVTAAEQVLKDAVPPPPGKGVGLWGERPSHPVLDELNTNEAQLEQAAKAELGDLGRVQEGIDAEMLPQILNTEMDIARTGAQIKDIARGADPEYNQIAMEEGMDALEKRRALADEAEQAKVQKGELTAEAKRIDEETGEFQVVYNDAVENYEKYRDAHREIADKADANRVLRAKDRTEMLPKGTKLDQAAEGIIPAYEAQPLQRTVDDLNKVIAANPNGDDALMSRAEAALYPIEQKLSQLTTELDIPARDVEQIIAAARKGELAPVISYVMKSNWKQVWTGGDVVISKELEAAYRNLTSAMANPGDFSRVLTAYTNFFKTYATLTPGFHVRNGLSAIFMNTVDGVTLTNQLDGVRLWREYAKTDSPLEWLMAQDQQTQDAFAAVFSSGAGGRYNEAGFAKSTSTGRRRQTAFNNPLTRLSQRIGQDWTEGPVRLGMALDSVRAGKSVTDAMGRITRIHFDYGQVSKFDEKAKRLIPFWTFMSRNLPMQITEMWSKPKVYAWFNSFVRNTKGEDVEGTPGYFGDIGAYPFADTKLVGMPLFLQPDLGHVRVQTDLQDIENMLSGENLSRPLTNINPLFTALPEYIAKRDLYTGREFQDTDLRKLGPLEKLGQPVLDMLNLTKTAPDGTKLVEERLPNMLQALNPIYARSARLLPGVTTGAPENTQQLVQSWARAFGGLPIRTLSPEQQKNTLRSERFDKEKEQRMRKAMAKAAAGG